jgi:hypothetical protein
MSKFTIVFSFLGAILATSCVSLAPEAKLVQVTQAPADVAGCKILGTVESTPPYVGPKDGMRQMQNKVAGLGGNVLFVTSYNVTGSGMAYQCGQAPLAPLPIPAAPPKQ